MLHVSEPHAAAHPVPAEHAELIRMAHAGQLQPWHFARMAQIAVTHPQLFSGLERGAPELSRPSASAL
ncbi:hypothetical protein [Streptomyces sp. NPDC001380]|uniref:hypothetical protein n=1 Tax=Streptomyces sp. NPDC001380 TaxID=3364566 RepID=UPI003690653A